MAAGGVTRGKAVLAIIVAALVGAALTVAAGLTVAGGGLLERLTRPPAAETVVDSALVAVRRQQRLTVFAASFAAVVTSTQQRFGLTARQTLIVPGTVRYVLDLAPVTRRDLDWNAETRTLTVRRPALLLQGPEIAVERMRTYGESGLLGALTDAEERLDAANRAAVRRDLLAQARSPELLRLAEAAADDALTRTFALPLEAAGVDAKVVVASR